MIKKTMITFSALAVVGSVALADDHHKKMEAHHKEMVAKMENIFKKQDLNRDGVVSHAEMTKKVEEAFLALDKNKDKMVDYNELPEKMEELAALLHGKEEAKLRAEMRQKMKDMHSQKVKKHQDMKKPDDKNGEGMKRHKVMKHREMKMPENRIDFIKFLDRNKDEKISMDEFMQPAIRRFKRADINGDGGITFDEMKQGMDNHMKRHMKVKERREKREERKLKRVRE